MMTAPDGPTPRTPRGMCLSCHAYTPQRYVRRTWAGGGGYHIMLVCPICSGNARGTGQWVARQEVIDMGLDPDTLPDIGPGDGADPRQWRLL